MEKLRQIFPKNVRMIVIVAALGYFVDIYDLVTFSIIRVESFKAIGVLEENMRIDGEYVLNMQMGGLLLGGIIWGVLGDKFGRVKVLFGSILMYSLGNIANAFVTDIHTYAIIRFITGIGLAGELGAGITLVSETMDKKYRGYGTMLVATIGILGATVAFLISDIFDWKVTFITGGVMGLFLLLLRVRSFESGLFKTLADSNVKKGSFKLLISDFTRFKRYVYCLLIGLPIWFVIGILITQSPEIGRILQATEPLSAGEGILFSYIGLAIGDIFAGLLAQRFRSRRKVMLIFQVSTLFAVYLYMSSVGISPAEFNIIALLLGLSVGYWATFVTIASEQFGTNLRATVTTTAPNFVRGALIPITYMFEFFVNQVGIIHSSYIIIIILTLLSLFALSQLKESFDKDLEYIEE